MLSNTSVLPLADVLTLDTVWDAHPRTPSGTLTPGPRLGRSPPGSVSDTHPSQESDANPCPHAPSQPRLVFTSHIYFHVAVTGTGAEGEQRCPLHRRKVAGRGDSAGWERPLALGSAVRVGVPFTSRPTQASRRLVSQGLGDEPFPPGCWGSRPVPSTEAVTGLRADGKERCFAETNGAPPPGSGLPGRATLRLETPPE